MILCFAGCPEARRRRGVGPAGVLLALSLLVSCLPRSGAEAQPRTAPTIRVVEGTPLACDALDEAVVAAWKHSLALAGLHPLPEVWNTVPYTLTNGEGQAVARRAGAILSELFDVPDGLPAHGLTARNHLAQGDAILLPGAWCDLRWPVEMTVATGAGEARLTGYLCLAPSGLSLVTQLSGPMVGTKPERDVTLALLDFPQGLLTWCRTAEARLGGGTQWATEAYDTGAVLRPTAWSPWPTRVKAWSDGQTYLLNIAWSQRSPLFSPVLDIPSGRLGVDPIESCLPRFEGFPEVWEVDLVSPDLSEPVTPEATLAAVLDGALGRSPLTGKAKAFRLFSSREWLQARPEAPPLAVRKLLRLADGFTCPTLHVRGDRVLGDVTAGLVRMQPGDDTHNGWPNRLAEARALVQWVSGDGYVALTTLNPSDALDARTPGGAPWGDSALSRNAPSEFGKTHGQYVLEGLLGQLGQGLCWLPWDVEAAGDRTHVRLTPDPEAQVGYPTRSRLGDTVWGGVQMWVDGVVTHTVIPTER